MKTKVKTLDRSDIAAVTVPSLNNDQRMKAAILSGVRSMAKRYLPVRAQIHSRRVFDYVRTRLVRTDLCALATYFGTDKWNSHWYAQHYQHHFHSFRRRRIKVLEIGVGGYDDPHDGGQSLRMWKAYFPNARIYGIDIHDKSALQEPRIRIFRGSQADPRFLESISRDVGPFDIIIDDGSHINEHVLASFEVLFPLLVNGGIYAIEDTQTSYWPGVYGGSRDADAARTTMGRMKALIDGLNYQEFHDNAYAPTYFDKNIVSLHFYHNLAILVKGRNDKTDRHRAALESVGSV